MSMLKVPQWVDEYVIPFSREDLESRYAEFMENEARGQCINGHMGGYGPVIIYENGAVWSDKHARVRGPFQEGSVAAFDHRRKFIEAKQHELDTLKEAYAKRHNAMVKRIQYAADRGQALPDDIEQEIDEVGKLKRQVEQKEREFDVLTEEDRKLEDSLREDVNQAKIENQDKANVLLRKLGVLPPGAYTPEEARDEADPTTLHVTQFDE